MFLIFVSPAFAAAGDLAIRLEEPKTPTNLSDFPVTFVVLDKVGGRNVSVSCYRQFEGGPVGSYDIAHIMTPDGNTGSCQVTSAVFNAPGTYTLSVQAVADGDVASDGVSVTYTTERPGDPRDYSKNRVDSCHYTIKFKTADDSSKTVRVEAYRSTEKTFTADDGSRVATIDVGSNTEKSFTDTVPDCGKDYYYALRAFNVAGNGLGVVGDQEIKSIYGSTTTSATEKKTGQGAIPVRQGSILGVENDATVSGTSSSAGQILGTSGNDVNASSSAQVAGIFARFPALRWILSLGAIILVAVWLKRRSR